MPGTRDRCKPAAENRDKTTVTARIPQGLADAAREHAERPDVTLSAYILSLLESDLNVPLPPQLSDGASESTHLTSKDPFQRSTVIDPNWHTNQIPMRKWLIRETARLLVEDRAAADGRPDFRWEHGTLEQQNAVIEDVTDFFYAYDHAMHNLAKKEGTN